MLVTVEKMKSYLSITDTPVATEMVADAVGAIYDKTVTGDGYSTLAELFGTGYTFTSGGSTILAYLASVSTIGGGPAVESSFTGNVGNATWDSFLIEQINLFSSTVENYCGRKFESNSYVQTFYRSDFDHQEIVTLPMYHFPVISVASVSEITTSQGVTTTTTVLETYSYRENNTFGSLRRVDSGVPVYWFSGLGYDTEIAVEYTAGYATVPLEIQSVVKTLVEERYNKKSSGVDLGFGSDVQSVSIPGTISISYDYSLQGNERKTKFGMLLGNQINVLDFFRSERSLIGQVRDSYVV